MSLPTAGKLSLILLTAGCVALSASGMGLVCYNGRWYGKDWVEEWTWEAMASNKRVADSVITSGIFGCVSSVLAGVGFVFVVADVSVLRSTVVIIVATVLCLATFVSSGIVLCECNMFDEVISMYGERQDLWVPWVDRDFINRSIELREWFFSYWEKQALYAGSYNIYTVSMIMAESFGWHFTIPVTQVWNLDAKEFHPVHAYQNGSSYILYASSCVVDFRDEATVYEFRTPGLTRDVCDTLKVKTVDCYGCWNEERMMKVLKGSCSRYYDDLDGVERARRSEGNFNTYYNGLDKLFTRRLIEEGLASLYMANAIFMGIQVAAVLLIIPGIALSSVSDDLAVSTNKLMSA